MKMSEFKKLVEVCQTEIEEAKAMVEETVETPVEGTEEILTEAVEEAPEATEVVEEAVEAPEATEVVEEAVTEEVVEESVEVAEEATEEVLEEAVVVEEDEEVELRPNLVLEERNRMLTMLGESTLVNEVAPTKVINKLKSELKKQGYSPADKATHNPYDVMCMTHKNGSTVSVTESAFATNGYDVNWSVTVDQDIDSGTEELNDSSMERIMSWYKE